MYTVVPADERPLTRDTADPTSRRSGRITISSVPVAPKKLDGTIGDAVEIDGWRYYVVSDKQGDIPLEPTITMTVAEMIAEHGGRLLTPQEPEGSLGTFPRTTRDRSASITRGAPG